MKKIVAALLIMLSLAGITYTALNTHFTNYPELEDALVTSGISDREYEHKIYDCREYSAVCDYYLKSRGFDSGLCLIAVGEDPGHRIVWVRLPNEIVFVEPQCNRIMQLSELPEHYESMTWIKLYDFDNGEDIFIKPTETGEYII